MILNKIQTYWRENSYIHSLWRHLPSLAILIIIAGVAYWAYYAPILYSDDWSLMLGRWYLNDLRWFDLTEQRPLLKICLVLLYSVL